MADEQIKKMSGRPARYRRKTAHMNFMFTDLAARIIRAAARRNDVSEADVLEQLTRDYGGAVTFDGPDTAE